MVAPADKRMMGNHALFEVGAPEKSVFLCVCSLNHMSILPRSMPAHVECPFR